VSGFIEFFLIGLSTGALYVLLSLGIVVIYRGSGVVNFAQGAVSMLATFVFWKLNQHVGLPYGTALLLALVGSGILGALIHYMVMKPLAAAAPVTRLIASLGVLVVIEQLATVTFGPAVVILPSELPTSSVHILGATVTRGELIVFGIALVVTLVLSTAYRVTKFGTLTLASAENRRAFRLLGYSPDSVAAVNWAIGSMLGALAGILLASFTGLQIDQYTLLVIPALSAAVIGNLTSFGWTLVGGLAVGVAQAEITHYSTTTGLAALAPFGILIAVLVIRGQRRTSRTSLAVALPRLGSGRTRWWVACLLVLAAIGLIESMSSVWLNAFTLSLAYGTILLSVVLITGYSGQLSLAQVAFAGFGAWVAGRLAAGAHLPLSLSWLFGVLLTLPLGLLVGVVCLRTRGVYLAITTLGLALALEQLVFDSANLTGGFAGTVINKPVFLGLAIDSGTHPRAYALVALGALVLGALVIGNIRNGRSGRRMIAVRANERAAASLGVNVVGTKVTAFGVASMIAALGGILVAFQQPNIQYTNFSAFASILVLPLAVVGGVGWISGAVIGGFMQVNGLSTQVLDLLGTRVSTYLALATGVLLILTLLVAPDGLAYLNWQMGRDIAARARSLLRHRGEVAASSQPDTNEPRDGVSVQAAVATALAQGHRVRPALIEVTNATVRFGGVSAVSHADLRVGAGEVVGLIGPNGAGKTSLVDAISGYVRLSGGAVLLDDTDVSSWSPARRARNGLTRSFQSIELFEDMTVRANLTVASDPGRLASFVTDIFYPRRQPLSSAANAAIAEFGLGPELDRVPGELSYGQRRLVGIARAVATSPSILLLDEPAAGLDDQETAELGELITSLSSSWGMGIVLIEHDMNLVMGVCDRIYAMRAGEMIADGTPYEIRYNADVVASYLGAESSALVADA
jgi:ABC-type branched-subunit amino acid transport system ATPase component/branched-subunit amino acid ABC-type transport system permease component